MLCLKSKQTGQLLLIDAGGADAKLLRREFLSKALQSGDEILHFARECLDGGDGGSNEIDVVEAERAAGGEGCGAGR